MLRNIYCGAKKAQSIGLPSVVNASLRTNKQAPLAHKGSTISKMEKLVVFEAIRPKRDIAFSSIKQKAIFKEGIPVRSVSRSKWSRFNASKALLG